MCSLYTLAVRMNNLCPVLCESVVCICLPVDSANQGILEIFELLWLICVTEALPASSVCFRNEVLPSLTVQKWQSHTWLCQYRSNLKNVGFQNITSLNALKALPDKRVSEGPFGSSLPRRRKLPTFWVFPRSLAAKWLPVIKVFPKAALRLACSFSFCVRK